MMMTKRPHPSKTLARAAVVGALVLGVLASSLTSVAQELTDIQVPTEPLELQSRGSFIVGGESVEHTPDQLSFFTDAAEQPAGHVTINQMYVEYMVPVADNGLPVVMLHGATLSGKSYDTTPDGRMGWYEYFVRQGHPVYIPDQVSRARSGFDIATYNEVRAGIQPPSALPNFWRFGDELVWTQFRFGPAAGRAFPDEQFPVEAADEFSKQAIPDLNLGLPTPNPNIAAVADLAGQLDGAVLLGHSQTGMLPVDAALADPTGIAGMIVIEPGSCRSADFTDEQISALTTIPILAVFGDHLDATTGTPVVWQNAYDDCMAFVDRINAAGGDAEMLHPPGLGIHGNSHMIMMDKNNLEIADLILAWIDQNVRADGVATPVATP
jgi:pimeloyl-ACP methyl ester carboxylesterase